MFAGWFKIDGHSNPQPKRGFQESINYLRKKQRVSKSARINSYQFYPKKNRTKLILGILVLILMIALLVVGIRFSLSEKNSGVVNKMEELTGSSEFISREKRNMIFANQEFEKGNYTESYNYYKEAYEFGTSDKEVIKGLWKSSEKLCEISNRYCEVSRNWKKLHNRIK